LSDLAAWLGVAIAILSLVVAYIAYKAQRAKLSLEYIVLSNYRILPKPEPSNLQVIHNHTVVPDAHLTVIRLVNTGDKAFTPSDFHSSLNIKLDGVRKVMAADVTFTRPANLRVALTVTDDAVSIAPTLINPGDLVQIQFITSSTASISIDGRVANLSEVKQRMELPYPPGTGPEGEIVSFEKVIWYAIAPAIIASTVSLIAFTSSFTLAAKISLAASISIALVAIYLMQVNFLVKRRRRWGAR
jgi:hypothetical protein